MEASAIFFISLDENVDGLFWKYNGENNNQLDRACSAVPWLIVLGHVLTYCALFGKVSYRGYCLLYVEKVTEFCIECIIIVIFPISIL